MYSTAEDLSRWQRALRSEELLSSESRRMFTDHGNGYGYGVSVYEQSGDAVFEQNGRLAGYASGIARYAGLDAVVILLSNVQSVARAHLRGDTGALLSGREPEIRSPRPSELAAASAAELAQLAGSYGFGPGRTVVVRTEAAALYLRANEGAESEFFPTEDGTFFSRTLYATVTFERGAEGDVVAMRYMPEGGEFRGDRLAP